MTYLALDIETVLDVDLGKRTQFATRPLDIEYNDSWWRRAMREQQLEATQGKSDFLKPIYHRICAIGAAYYDDVTWKSNSESLAGDDEEILISHVLGWLRKRPTLVTYNGRQFDLPVLKQRAMLYNMNAGVLYGPAGGKQWEMYDYRYGGPHLDIADALTNYGAGIMPKLHELALACGMAGKSGDGSQVEALYEARDWPTLQAYVEQDARLTLALGLRFERSRGRLPSVPSLFAEPVS